ncbi:MAG: ABC transporter ATP-binding protein [Eubacteriales bacterium]|nr:ABC transporter ATP-binding protein [Eubacteriales bacterium]
MITVEHLTKRYGDFTAVNDLSFEIEDGHVYGFLGSNGAGKSTTMNMMTGCLSVTDGHVSIDGHDIFKEPKEAKKLIGYLPEIPPLYMNDTPLEYLKFVAEAKGLKGTEVIRQAEDAMERTGITAMKDRRIAALSKGYKQRVGIAQALLGNPKVIILDEPTVGLDPIQIIDIRNLIKDLGQTHTVILSSHILSEVQAICDRILIISHGRLIAFDTPDNLEKLLTAPNEVSITTDASPEEAKEILSKVEALEEVSFEDADSGYLRANIRTKLDNIYELSAAIFTAFAGSSNKLLEMNLKKADLEEIFIGLTENDGKTVENDEQKEDM